MPEPEAVKKMGVEMPESMHVAIKMEAARRRVKIKQAVKQAFELWLNPSSANQTPTKKERDTTPVPISPEVQPLIQLLHRAIEKGVSISTLETIIIVGTGLKPEAGIGSSSEKQGKEQQRKMRHGGGPVDVGRKP
jgi:hypothetical protein